MAKGWSFGALTKALKGAAFLDVGSSAGTVAAGDDTRIVNAVPNTRKVNSKPLSANVVLEPSDIKMGDIYKQGIASGLMGSPGRINIPMIINNNKVTAIVQWGEVFSAEKANTTGVFAVPFPTECLHIVATGLQSAANTQAYVTLNYWNRNLFTCNCFIANAAYPPLLARAGEVRVYYIAIGW